MKNEAEIRELIENWTRAVATGDRKGVLAHHSPDLLMYDFPDTKKGIDAYDEQWNFFYANPHGPISFVPRDIEVTADGEVAFTTCMIHCDGTSAGPLDLRLTTGLRKIDGEWTIVHEHHSVPTIEKQFLDSEGQTEPAQARAAGAEA